MKMLKDKIIKDKKKKCRKMIKDKGRKEKEIKLQ